MRSFSSRLSFAIMFLSASSNSRRRLMPSMSLPPEPTTCLMYFPSPRHRDLQTRQPVTVWLLPEECRALRGVLGLPAPFLGATLETLQPRLQVFKERGIGTLVYVVHLVGVGRQV